MDESRLTNWPAVKDFVPTTHSDTYPYISTSIGDLSGKSVLITGASKGIGRAIALSFARSGCSKIALVARSSLASVEQEIAAAAAEADRTAPQVLSIQVDLTSEAGVGVAASQLENAWNSLDVLVNNAGRCETVSPLTESLVDDFWSSWEVNIKGTYLCVRKLAPMLLKSTTRTVIIVNTAGAHLLTPGLCGYQTSKFALCRFTEFLAKDFEEWGLIAISLHPGGVLTNMTTNTPISWHVHLQDDPRLAADTIVWLAKQRRSWLSGRYISSTWDMAELEARKTEIVDQDLLKFRLKV